jgi:hypothetical protein
VWWSLGHRLPLGFYGRVGSYTGFSRPGFGYGGHGRYRVQQPIIMKSDDHLGRTIFTVMLAIASVMWLAATISRIIEVSR